MAIKVIKKSIVCALLIATLTAQTANADQVLICKPIEKDTKYSWRSINWKQSLHGMYQIGSYYAFTSMGRPDLIAHTLVNEGFHSSVEGASPEKWKTATHLGTFAAISSKEFFDKTGFSTSDILLGNLPALLWYLPYGKMYRGANRLIGRKLEPKQKALIMRDDQGKGLLCAWGDERLVSNDN